MKRITTFLFAFFMAVGLFAQSPEKMTYQAVVRDINDNLITNQGINMRVSILQGTASGTAVYMETHAVETNDNGLLSIEIGAGNVLSGSFDAINWSAGPYFLKTETDPEGGSNYSITGISQMLSVPYAMHAKEAENVANESDPVYSASPAAEVTQDDIVNLDNLSGVNTGDQDISGIAENTQAIKDTAEQIRACIPDMSGYLTTEVDPVYTASEAAHITAEDINNLSNLSGINTGDQDITGIGMNTQAIMDTAAQIRSDIPDVSGFITEEVDPVYTASVAAGITDADTTYWNNKLSVEVDGSVTNEIQDLSISNDTLYLTDGGFAKLPTAAMISDLDGDTKIQVEESDDEDIIRFDVGGSEKWRMRGSALENMNGDSSLFIGYESGLNDDLTDNKNTFIGFQSGYSTTSGFWNTAIGFQSLYKNTTGAGNIVSGYKSLYNNTAGFGNIALGNYTLYNNTTGYTNLAWGDEVLYSNIDGGENLAAGYAAMYNNISGGHNIALGFYALHDNTTGFQNIGIGTQALEHSTNAIDNVAVGVSALKNNVVGQGNVAVGMQAGYDPNGVNYYYSTFLGYHTKLNAERWNVTMLGSLISGAQCTGNNQMILGSTQVQQIRAQVSGITTYSDERFKTQVKEDVSGLDFILRLKPVTYVEKPELLHEIWGTPDSVMQMMDHSGMENVRFIGLLAQDVEKAAKESGFDFPGIDVPRNSKEVYSLRYTDFIMPVIKATQEQQAIIEEQQRKIDQQQLLIEDLTRRIEALEVNR